MRSRLRPGGIVVAEGVGVRNDSPLDSLSTIVRSGIASSEGQCSSGGGA